MDDARITRRLGLATTIFACAIFAACGGNDSNAGTDTVASGASAAADSAAAAAAATPPGMGPAAGSMELPTSEGGMVDVLALVNQAEVEAGMLARDSAENAEVKAFARRMVQEHSGAMRQEGELVQSAGITGATISTTQGDSTVKGPTVTGTGAASTLQSMHSQTMDRLRSADGAAFDRAYIESEVAVHQQALDLLQRMQGQVQNAQLKEHVTKLIPVVQSHLDRARQLQSSLGTGGTTDTGRTATDTARKG